MSDRFEFVCPHCETTTIVDEEMRTTILRNGCVLCRQEVNGRAFSQRT